MIVDAVRYALGRQTYQVETTCSWVINNWLVIGARIKLQIIRDVEGAFSKYEHWEKCKSKKVASEQLANKYRFYLGDGCDVQQWKKVRELWQKN